jgi:hypothetical protein
MAREWGFGAGGKYELAEADSGCWTAIDAVDGRVN